MQTLDSELLAYLRCCPNGVEIPFLEAQERFDPYLPKPFLIIINETTKRLLKIQE